MDTSCEGGRRNRSWPEALKREIVAACDEPGSSVAGVARRYGVNANQVFGWRRRFLEEPAGPQLVPVTITPATPCAPTSEASSGTIEVVLKNGYRVRIDGNVDASSLRRVLDVLERR